MKCKDRLYRHLGSEYAPIIWILLNQKSRPMVLDVQLGKEWQQDLKLGCAQPLEAHMEELVELEEQRPGIHSRWRNV